jgi:pyruvate carboxylase
VLDLDPRVDLDKVDAPRVDEELARSGVAVPEEITGIDIIAAQIQVRG